MDEPHSTGRRGRELATLLGVGAFLLVADQVSKGLVASNIAMGQQVDVIGSVVQIWHAENAGAAFSLFQNLQPVFLAVGVLALGLVAYFARAFHGRSLWLFLVLGVVLGGTLGNLFDRVVRGGRVIDFVSVGIGNLRWPTFNVADSSLVVGILALVVILWFFDGETRPAASSGEAGAGADAAHAGAAPGAGEPTGDRGPR
jgi:signal peptidase II